MSQRNPMNDRYTTDEHTGVSRKSAASAKPKSKAASSVIVKSSKKTPQEKKAEQKEERRKARAKQAELDRKYYTPTTARYHKLRRMWIFCLGIAVVFMILAMLMNRDPYRPLSITFIVLCYVFIIIGFYIDFSKVRKERMKFQTEMLALEEKQNREAKANARRAKTAKNQKKAQPVKVEESEKPAEEEKPKRKGLFGSGFRLKNREAEQKAKAAQKQAEAAAEAEEAKSAAK